jgi:hypothetical protein
MLSIDEEKRGKEQLVARDLTGFFNAVIGVCKSEQEQPGVIGRPLTHAELLQQVFLDVAQMIDFHSGSELSMRLTSTNTLDSAELAAIKVVNYLSRSTDQEAIDTLYRIMNDTVRQRNLPFHPASASAPQIYRS